jgi:hypothetical protein
LAERLRRECKESNKSKNHESKLGQFRKQEEIAQPNIAKTIFLSVTNLKKVTFNRLYKHISDGMFVQNVKKKKKKN